MTRRCSTRIRAPRTQARLLGLLAGPALLLSLAVCAHYARGGMEAAQSGPPMDPAEAFAEDPASGDEASGQVRFGKKTVIDFSDDTIEGDLAKPDGQYVESRRRLRNEVAARRVLAELARGRDELWVVARARSE